jgi:hypothetical protein
MKALRRLFKALWGTLLLLLAILLPGCDSNPPKPDQKPQDPVMVGVQVPVVVREKCHVRLPPEPKWAVEDIAKDATDFDKSKAILAEVEQRRDHINQLRAAAKGCE